MSDSKPLSVPDLEQVYDALATAIDTAGPGKSELLLVKLALLNAHELGDAALFQRQLPISTLSPARLSWCSVLRARASSTALRTCTPRMSSYSGS